MTSLLNRTRDNVNTKDKAVLRGDALTMEVFRSSLFEALYKSSVEQL